MEILKLELARSRITAFTLRQIPSLARTEQRLLEWILNVAPTCFQQRQNFPATSRRNCSARPAIEHCRTVFSPIHCWDTPL